MMRVYYVAAILFTGLVLNSAADDLSSSEKDLKESEAFKLFMSNGPWSAEKISSITLQDRRSLAGFESAYALSEKEQFKCILKPFPESRQLYCEYKNILPPTIPQHKCMLFYWDGWLQYKSSAEKDIESIVLAYTRDVLAKQKGAKCIQRWQVCGDGKLKSLEPNGDIVLRRNLQLPEVLKALNECFKMMTNIPLEIRLENRQEQIMLARRGGIHKKTGPIVIYGSHKGKWESSRGGWLFVDLCDWLSEKMDRPILCDSDTEQLRMNVEVYAVNWKDKHEGARALQHLTEQTGISFDDTICTVPVIVLGQKKRIAGKNDGGSN